jgi:hypothetical protein
MPTILLIKRLFFRYFTAWQKPQKRKKPLLRSVANYDDKLRVMGSFLDMVKAVGKDADKKKKPKNNFVSMRTITTRCYSAR